MVALGEGVAEHEPVPVGADVGERGDVSILRSLVALHTGKLADSGTDLSDNADYRIDYSIVSQ